jgi:alkanesulfonate monooxygenase SsuD/methylene tetrahydromethanopterin reductase-like flavin-dependent oxidoreductase (luciferase family)
MADASHTLDFGIVFTFRNPVDYRIASRRVYEEILDEIRFAESLGFDTVWLPEHHFSPRDGYNPSPLVTAAAIAARTSTIKIGTWLVLLPLGHAVRVAEDTAVLDNLSDGRFLLGAGLGYRKEEFEAYGVTRESRGRRMEEGLQILRRALDGERFSFSGRYYDIENLEIFPKPIQHPYPLWVGARAIPAAQRAARYDAHLQLVGVTSDPAETRAVYDAYADVLRDRGQDPARYGVHTLLTEKYFLSDDPERTWAEISPHVQWTMGAMHGWYEEAAESGHDPVLRSARERGTAATMRGRSTDPPRFDADTWQARLVTNDPNDTIAAIDRLFEHAPYTHLVVGPGDTNPLGYPAEKMYPYLERFAKEVIPHFKQSR